jgi:hypothetical protein
VLADLQETWQPLVLSIPSKESLITLLRHCGVTGMRAPTLSVLTPAPLTDELLGLSLAAFEKEGSPLKFSFEMCEPEGDTFIDNVLAYARGDGSRCSAYVASTSALGGVCRAVAVFVRVTETVPTAKHIAFPALTKVFDAYLSRLTVEFMPLGERGRYLGRPNKYSAPAPAVEPEFEALRAVLARNPADQLKPPSAYFPIAARLVAAESAQFCSQVN